MRKTQDHYQHLLAPVYLWMVGDLDAALERGESEIKTACPPCVHGQFAIDLGAGFGMHTLALARRGYDVLAVDTSPLLLDTLRTHAQGLNVQTVEDDLLTFAQHTKRNAHLIPCMPTSVLSPFEATRTASSLAS